MTQITNGVELVAQQGTGVAPEAAFLTVEQAAPQLQMSEQALYAACRVGQFPHIRIGRRIRIPARALAELATIQVGGRNNAR
jgi:excisionase family DNA binding protein